MWDAALIDRIKAEVPRYNGAHTMQVVNMLKKLASGDLPTLQIAAGQMDDAVMATVHQYAKMRDAEDAAATDAPLPGLADPVRTQHDDWPPATGKRPASWLKQDDRQRAV